MQIYIVTAHKRYSDGQKVLAAYDTADGAEQLKRTIEDLEPAWTISVVETELRQPLLRAHKPGAFIAMDPT